MHTAPGPVAREHRATPRVGDFDFLTPEQLALLAALPTRAAAPLGRPCVGPELKTARVLGRRGYVERLAEGYVRLSRGTARLPAALRPTEAAAPAPAARVPIVTVRRALRGLLVAAAGGGHGVPAAASTLARLAKRHGEARLAVLLHAHGWHPRDGAAAGVALLGRAGGMTDVGVIDAVEELVRLAEVFEVRALLWEDACDQTWCVCIGPRDGAHYMLLHGWTEETANLTDEQALTLTAERLHAAGWRPGMTAEDAARLLGGAT